MAASLSLTLGCLGGKAEEMLGQRSLRWKGRLTSVRSVPSHR
jgi:hypothetical protein